MCMFVVVVCMRGLHGGENMFYGVILFIISGYSLHEGRKNIIRCNTFFYLGLWLALWGDDLCLGCIAFNYLRSRLGKGRNNMSPVYRFYLSPVTDREGARLKALA